MSSVKNRPISRLIRVPMDDRPLDSFSLSDEVTMYDKVFLGVDIGLAHCGYAFTTGSPENPVIIESGVVITEAGESLEFRLETIYKTLKEKIIHYQPIFISIERLFHNAPSVKMGKDGHTRNKSAAILYTNMVSGIVLLIAAQLQIQWNDVVVGAWKKAYINKGNATKDEVKVRSLALTGKKKMMNDESDAIGIAVASLVKHYTEKGGLHFL